MNNQTSEETADLLASNLSFVLFDYVALVGLSGLGLVLSLISFFIFLSVSNENRLFNYLAVSSVTGAIYCVLNILQFVEHVFLVSDDFVVMIFQTYVYIPGILVCYQFGSFLDIVALLDRISIFNRKVQERMQRWSLTTGYVSMLACSALINAAYYIYFTIDSVSLTHDSKNSTTWYLTTTGFGRTQWGIILMSVIAAIRDIMITGVQVVLNIVSIRQLKTYMKSRVHSVGSTGAQTSRKRVDVRLGIMVIFLCGFSILEHLVCSVCSFFLIQSVNSTSVLTFRLSLLALTLKPIIDFILYLSFNRVFRYQMIIFIKKVI